MLGRARRVPCIQCGRATTNASLCDNCKLGRRTHQDPEYQANRVTVLAHADRCAICQQPPTHNNPLECDHIIPLEHGGDHSLGNLRAGHRSCNRKRKR